MLKIELIRFGAQDVITSSVCVCNKACVYSPEDNTGKPWEHNCNCTADKHDPNKYTTSNG